MALGAGSKNGKEWKNKVRPDDVIIDPEYPGKKEKDARMKAMTYKFLGILIIKVYYVRQNATLNKFVKGYPRN